MQVLPLTVASLIMFIIANVFPIVAVELQGIPSQTTLLGAVLKLNGEGMPFVASAVLSTTILFPLFQLLILLYLFIPLPHPGVTVKRPMPVFGFDDAPHGHMEIIFDNVRVPADALVGEINRGWEILVGSLGTERAFVGGAILMKLALQLEELCDYIRTVETDGQPLRLDPLVRDTIGGFAAEIEAGRQLALNCVHILARGEMPTWEAAITKVYAGELMERFNEAALDILGMEATLSAGAPGAPLRGRLEQKLRHSLMWVISIGSNEIQRSLIAQRGLELPR